MSQIADQLLQNPDIYAKYPSIPKEFEGIKLDLDWRELSPLKFVEGISTIHEDNCQMYSLSGWDEDNCNCNPKFLNMITGSIKVFRTNGPDDDKRYWMVSLPVPREDFEKVADKHGLDKKNLNLLWTLPEMFPLMLEEDIKNGKQTLYTMLKYYEVTGEQLDFLNEDIKDLDKILYDKI